ncbi:hypothetical protein RJT34_20220 [Clitoria ternatea]|uniref:Uncharacterized protein n=1 Tax=Clitoria ternatea TaxID=43366 RepID=A0AAN9ISG6_CLITE
MEETGHSQIRIYMIVMIFLFNSFDFGLKIYYRYGFCWCKICSSTYSNLDFFPYYTALGNVVFWRVWITFLFHIDEDTDFFLWHSFYIGANLCRDGTKKFDEVFEQPDPTEGLKKLVDPRLGDNCPIDSVMKMAQLAKVCTENDPQKRPNISSVVVTLTALISTTED